MAQKRLPNLALAQWFETTVVHPRSGVYQGDWLGDPEIDALNHALTIGHPTLDIEALAARVLRVLQQGYASHPAPRFGRDWHKPLAKVSMPLLLRIMPRILVAPLTLLETASGEYRYCKPGKYGPRKVLVDPLAPFERCRPAIEAMWAGPVFIETWPDVPGGVRVRPKGA